jgi:hypothetical protein
VDAVKTLSHDEAAVRKYIQEQEKEDQRLEQLGLFEGQSRFERLQPMEQAVRRHVQVLRQARKRGD